MGNCSSTNKKKDDKTIKSKKEEPKKNEKVEAKKEEPKKEVKKEEPKKEEPKKEVKKEEPKKEVKTEEPKKVEAKDPAKNEDFDSKNVGTIVADQATKVYKDAVCSFKNFTKKATKFENFTNAFVKELNYSALQINRFYKNQQPYNGSELYTDDVFPPNEYSIFGYDSNGNPIDTNEERRMESERDFTLDKDEIIWLRPNEIFGSEYALFEGNIEFDDVKQGSIGNCYFMASISALTEVPQIIAEIFRVHEVQTNGYYEVCLKIDGVWQVVILDDYIPCNKRTRRPIFANPKGNELWAILLEKAWAKVNGGYINTVAGMASEVIECLTNFPYEYNSVENSDADELWQKILVASKNDYIMTAALPARDGAEERGLVTGHEYTLQEGREYFYNGELLKLLKIRNPWGSIKYSGEWGPDDSKWNDDLKEAFNYKEVYDGEGEFLISYDDFLRFFADVDICKIEDRICMKQQVLSYEETRTPNLFQIKIFDDSDITVTMFKPYYRFIRDLPSQWTVTQNLLIAKCDDEDNYVFSNFIGKCEGQDDCTITARLSAGTYYFYSYINYDEALDFDRNPLDRNVISQLHTCISVYSTEFFGFNQVKEENSALLHRMVLSYFRQNPQDSSDIVVRTENNFLKSEFYVLYIKNTLDKILDMKISFDTLGLSPLSNFINSKSDIITLFPDQEFVYILTCPDIYTAHGFKIGFGKRENKKAQEAIDYLPFMKPIPEYNLKSRNIKNYNWIYKKGDVDYKNILKKIDASDAAFKHFKTTGYEKEVSQVELVPKLANHDELELIVQERVDFGDGDWYFGEWKNKDGEQVMYGRGMAVLSGNTFIGQFINHAFTGFGKMILPNNDVIQGEFESFQPKGKCSFTHNDGRVEQRQYS